MPQTMVDLFNINPVANTPVQFHKKIFVLLTYQPFCHNQSDILTRRNALVVL